MDGIRLAAWDSLKPRKTVVPVGLTRLGEEFTLLAGLTGTLDKARLTAAAQVLKDAGAGIIKWNSPVTPAADGRAGTADAERFALLREVRALTGLATLVEVTDTREVSLAADAADMLMVGAANMQNFSLLKELGRSAKKPVLLVRGWHATLMEWLNSAEYVLFEGNPEVVLCEGGIRTYEAGSRVVLDLSAVPALKKITHLPVLVDLARAGGPEEVEKMGLAAVAAGADGLMVGVAAEPDPAAPSRERKGLPLEAFADLVRKWTAMRSLLEGIGDDHS
jgi:3-deoxy-7-phosphoheptulonate synthase